MTRARVAVGSDDLYPVLDFLLRYLDEKGFEVLRYGSALTGRPEPWPLVARSVARSVARGEASWGILVCYTGTGVTIVANKVRGVRAALCNDAETAKGARLWNNANILALSGRLVTPYVAKEILDAWLSVASPDPSELENIRMIEEVEREEYGATREA